LPQEGNGIFGDRVDEQNLAIYRWGMAKSCPLVSLSVRSLICLLIAGTAVWTMTLPAHAQVTPDGTPFIVNTYTTGYQLNSEACWPVMPGLRSLSSRSLVYGNRRD
jgi:hypothetical protein